MITIKTTRVMLATPIKTTKGTVHSVEKASAPSLTLLPGGASLFTFSG